MKPVAEILDPSMSALHTGSVVVTPNYRILRLGAPETERTRQCRVFVRSFVGHLVRMSSTSAAVVRTTGDLTLPQSGGCMVRFSPDTQTRGGWSTPRAMRQRWP